MQRTGRTLLAAVTLVLLPGCGAAREAAPVATTSTGVAQRAAGLRGVVVSAPDCPAATDAPFDATATITVAPAAVTALRLCPLPLPGEAGGPVPVDLAAKDARLGPLVRALAEPDRPPVAGQACAAYADLQQTVLATLDDGRRVRVQIPTDECAHYQREVSGLLAAARGPAGPAPSTQR